MEWFDNLIKMAERNWTKKSTIVFILIVIFAAYISIISVVDFSKMGICHWLIILVILICVFIFWFYSNKVPKFKKGQKGILVAIKAESEDDLNIIEADFISPLRDEANSFETLSILSLPVNVSKKITNFETAKIFCKKYNAVMVIFGNVKKREINGCEHRLFSLDYLIIHKPLPEAFHKLFEKDFSDLNMRRFGVEKKNEVIALEITAKYISFSIKYFLACAGCFDKNYTLSEKLLFEAYNNVLLKKATLPALIQLYSRVKNLIVAINEQKLTIAYENWLEHSSQENLQKYRVVTDFLATFCPNHYGAHLAKAIFYFEDGRNIRKSLNEINKCKGVNYDAGWIYSKAFLYGYQGKLSTARRTYMIAFKKDISNTQLLHIDEFILRVIRLDHQVEHLFFCLGLISYYVHIDMRLTQDYFSCFCKHEEYKMKFPEEYTFAMKIINDVQKNIL